MWDSTVKDFEAVNIAQVDKLLNSLAFSDPVDVSGNLSSGSSAFLIQLEHLKFVVHILLAWLKEFHQLLKK